MLGRSMLATAAALAAANSGRALSAAEDAPAAGPNDKLLAACIGVNGRGRDHYSELSNRKDVEIAVICDADEVVGQKACDALAKKTGRRPEFVHDMRNVFDNKAINFITTATPNHWHALTAIWAMQAGKDVYLEKPVSHNVSEGRRIVEVARKENKICQTGTQSRSNKGMQAAMDYIHSGKLGEVKLARGLCYKARGSIGARGTYDISKTINYDLWSGPAPILPLTRQKLHYDWHWQWAYGNGDLGNQGIHQMDLCRWALQVTQLSNSVLSYGGRFGYTDAGETPNTQLVIHDFGGGKTLVFEVRGLETGEYKKSKVGIIVEGSEGYLVMSSYSDGTVFDKGGNAQKEFKGGGDHYDNFIKAVRNRKIDDLNADILQGHLSSALCHLGNISYRLGRQVGTSELQERLKSLSVSDNSAETLDRTISHLADNKVAISDQTRFQVGDVLKFDPQTETFPGNDAANAQLTREYRAPFVVPSKV